MPLGHECNIVPGYYLYNLVTKHNFHTGKCDETRIVFRNTMSDFQNHPQLWAEQCPYTLKEGDFVEPCIVKNSATETLAAIKEYIDRELQNCKNSDEGIPDAIFAIRDIINSRRT